jgi:hypothetical protein
MRKGKWIGKLEDPRNANLQSSGYICSTPCPKQIGKSKKSFETSYRQIKEIPTQFYGPQKTFRQALKIGAIETIGSIGAILEL